MVASIGFSRDKLSWNHFHEYLHSQWLHVLPSYINESVRDDLIMESRREAKEMGYDISVLVPEYLRRKDDGLMSSLGGAYFMDRNLYGE
jgi:hypothetical protein